MRPILALALAGLTGCAAPPMPPPQPVPGSGTPFSLPIRLVGTEPFWGGRIAADSISITGVDRAELSAPAVAPLVTGAGARWRSGGLDITLLRQPCSDGMSDRRYPFQATVRVAAETLRGCAIPEAQFGGAR